MKRIKKIYIIAIVINLFFSFSILGQIKDKVKYIDNKVANNILIYRIKNTNYISEGQEVKDGFINRWTDYRFFNIMPDNGYKMVLEIDSLNDLNYPNNKFVLLSVFRNGYNQRLWEDKDVEELITSHLSPIVFPLSKTNTPYTFARYSKRVFDRYYLIAINKNLEIKFISGNFYLSRIAEDFDLDIESPETFYHYLRLKLFNTKAKDIIYKERKKNYLIFEAFSDIINNSFLIKVNEKDFDDIELEFKKLNR